MGEKSWIFGLIAAIALGITVLLFASGCQSPNISFDQAMTLVEKGRQVAREQGVSWKASLISSGDPFVYEQAGFGFNTGVRAELHFQGNAQTEASELPEDGAPGGEEGSDSPPDENGDSPDEPR